MQPKANGAVPPRRKSLESNGIPHSIEVEGGFKEVYSKVDEGERLLQLNSCVSSRNPSPSRSFENGSYVDIAGECSMIIEEFMDKIYGEDSIEREAAGRSFFEATRKPPITKNSLSELDIGSIINNSKLRHDVNFDRELHFRPNLDGERGRQKRKSQKMYWEAVAVELQLFGYILESQTEVKPDAIKMCSFRLQNMFETIKEILRNLVPDRDQSDVDDHLDVSMLMQEIGRGVCDFVSIAVWLAQLLKRHCAPMRDEMVDRMVEKIKFRESQSIAQGLCDLFGVLEAMKLDVANHQIRHLRALLIEDTINFEKKYHFSRMKKHRYRVKEARKWYKDVKDSEEFKRIPLTESWPNRDVEAFVTAFLQSLMPTNTTILPDTFALDADRIRLIRSELDDLVKENICCDVLNEVLNSKGRNPNADTKESFRARLHIIVNDGRSSTWHEQDIACEVVRHVLQACGSASETDADLEDMAAERLRAQFHDRTRTEKYARALEKELHPRIFRYVEDFLSSSPCDIFNALVAPPAPPPLCPVGPALRPVDRQQDIVQRSAHIAVLHWRIWEPLVYNNEDIDIQIHSQPTPPEIPTRDSTAQGAESVIRIPRIVPTVLVHAEMETDKKSEEVVTAKAPV